MCIICKNKNIDQKKTLKTDHCNNIEYIPETLDYLKQLSCISCLRLSSLPSTLKINKLICDYSFRITIIPRTLKYLNILSCVRCPISFIPDTFVNLKELDCSHCVALTELPVLKSLKILNISGCYNIEKLHCNFPLLEEIKCNGCIQLTVIEDMPKLKYLESSCCRMLIKIPSYITYANCRYSPWVNGYNNDYKNNIITLGVLQKWIKKMVRYIRFKKWINSKEGVEWIYDPDRIGGRISKNNLTGFLKGIENM